MRHALRIYKLIHRGYLLLTMRGVIGLEGRERENQRKCVNSESLTIDYKVMQPDFFRSVSYFTRQNFGVFSFLSLCFRCLGIVLFVFIVCFK